MNYQKTLKIILVSSFLLNINTSFATCSPSEIKNIRASALSLSKKESYKSAAHKLSDFYNEKCSFYDMSQESDKVLNDGLWLISDLMFYRNMSDNPLGCLSLQDDVYSSWMVSEPSRYEPKVEKALQENIHQARNMLDKAYLAPQKCPVKGYENMYAIPASWKEQNEMFYEVACVGFVANSKNVIGDQRDGPKLHSEGMNSIAKLAILNVSEVTHIVKTEPDPDDKSQWVRHYQLDQMYFTNNKDTLWGGDGYCYVFDLKFGHKAGMIFMDGASDYCAGGTASFINRVIVKLDYPLKVQVIDERGSIFK